MKRIIPLVFAGAFCPVLNGATVSFIELGTSGVYDEQTIATNSIGRTAPGSAYTASDFSTAVLAAYK